MSEQAKFKVVCPECDVSHSSDDFQRSDKFVDKHEEHTGHEMEYEKTDFDLLEQEDPLVRWTIYCDTCDVGWEFPEENEAVEFKDEHATYTDHEIHGDPEKEIVTVDVELKGSFSLKQLIEELEFQYDEGAPEEAVLAHANELGEDLVQVKREIEDLRQKGEIYVPRAGYFRVI